MWNLVFLLSLVASTKNILISPGYNLRSHSQPFKVLARRIGQDPDFNCFVVAEPEFKDLWQDVNCTILFLRPNENFEKLKELQESQMTNSEKGIATTLNELKSIVTAGFPFWNEEKIFEKLKDIGIDLAICDPFSSPCLVAAHNLKIPKSLYLSPARSSGYFVDVHQRDTNRIPVENFYWPIENIGFFDRVINAFKYKVFEVLIRWFFVDIAREYIPGIEQNDWRSNTLYKREALYVEPSIPFFNLPEILPPNYIHSGLLVDRVSRPLPASMLQFIEMYEEIIYVSFGSVSITYDITQIILLAQKLPKIGFIISYSKQGLKFTEIPKNCLVLPWVPQTDLLSSGKVDLFITHSGWNSFCESLFYGVPTVNCGWSVDRIENSFMAELRKVGKTVPKKEDFTAENLLKVTQEVLRNPIYKQNNLKYSKMLQKWDTEGKIIDAIKLFLEMGIENLVLENYYDLYWFQKNYLDIYAFWFGSAGFIIFMFVMVCKLIWKTLRKICTKNRIVKEKDN